jgi:hypothetical protein
MTRSHLKNRGPKVVGLRVVRRIEDPVSAAFTREGLFRQTRISPKGFHARIIVDEAQLRN